MRSLSRASTGSIRLDVPSSQWFTHGVHTCFRFKSLNCSLIDPPWPPLRKEGKGRALLSPPCEGGARGVLWHELSLGRNPSANRSTFAPRRTDETPFKLAPGPDRPHPRSR